jgi:hypothetical protein
VQGLDFDAADLDDVAVRQRLVLVLDAALCDDSGRAVLAVHRDRRVVDDVRPRRLAVPLVLCAEHQMDPIILVDTVVLGRIQHSFDVLDGDGPAHQRLDVRVRTDRDRLRYVRVGPHVDLVGPVDRGIDPATRLHLAERALRGVRQVHRVRLVQVVVLRCQFRPVGRVRQVPAHVPVRVVRARDEPRFGDPVGDRADARTRPRRRPVHPAVVLGQRRAPRPRQRAVVEPVGRAEHHVLCRVHAFVRQHLHVALREDVRDRFAAGLGVPPRPRERIRTRADVVAQSPVRRGVPEVRVQLPLVLLRAVMQVEHGRGHRHVHVHRARRHPLAVVTDPYLDVLERDPDVPVPKVLARSPVGQSVAADAQRHPVDRVPGVARGLHCGERHRRRRVVDPLFQPVQPLVGREVDPEFHVPLEHRVRVRGTRGHARRRQRPPVGRVGRRQNGIPGGLDRSLEARVAQGGLDAGLRPLQDQRRVPVDRRGLSRRQRDRHPDRPDQQHDCHQREGDAPALAEPEPPIPSHRLTRSGP